MDPPADDGAAAGQELPPLLCLGLARFPKAAEGGAAVLTVGDGDCGYSACLAAARPDLRVLATTYDHRGRVPDANALAVDRLECEVDFTEPLPPRLAPGAKWDRVVVNFPAPIGRRHVSRGCAMVREFFGRAAVALAPSGQLWLTLEAQAGGRRGDGEAWAVEEAAADAGLALIAVQDARARAAYSPAGARTDGELHVFQLPDGRRPLARGLRSLVRHVSLPARPTMDGLQREAMAIFAPLDVAVELLNEFARDDCAGGPPEVFWTVRVEASTRTQALSSRRVHALCQRLETGAGPPPAGETAEGPEQPGRAADRRKGWAVWFHKVEPDVEDLLALLARPVDRAEDANLLWTNAAWGHPTAFVNHFGDAALNKRDVALALRGQPFLPRTFVLPEEAEDWARASSPLWILKPARLGRGLGISVFPDWGRPDGSAGVVSDYIDGPLLISGRKVDLRLYVVVLSLDPVRAAVHANGNVRFASQPYGGRAAEPAACAAGLAPQAHLTNNSINRSAAVAPPPLPDGFAARALGPGDNWPLDALWARVDREVAWPRIRGLVAASVAGIAPKLRAAPGGRQFALLGFDVLLTSTLEPWLCEINANPSLGGRAIDREVDLEVVSGLLSILEGGAGGRWEFLQGGDA